MPASAGSCPGCPRRGRARGSLPEAPSPPSEEDVLERAPEVLVEDGVDDRVERAVAVADPEEELEERAGHLAGLAADAVQTVGEEEGEPAEHEHAHDHRQHEGEALLTRLGHLAAVQLFSTVGTVAHEAPLCMGFSRQEYWSGLLYPPPGDLHDPVIKSVSLTSSALAGRFFTTRTT